MSMTTAKQLMIKCVREKMRDPEWAKVLYDYATRLNTGEYPERYVDALFQKHWAEGAYTLEDAYAFAQMHTMIRTGVVAIFQIPIGGEPEGDRLDTIMNARLAELPYPFHGKFWGGTQGADGTIWWERPINVIKHREDGSGCGFVIAEGQDKSPHMPLEVGTTASEKSYLSFQGFDGPRGLARWPYGQDRITVFTRHWVGLGEPRFEELKEDVWGSFESLPNPWDDWWREGSDGK